MLSVLISKRNEVNWAKNEGVRAVFVTEVKIPESEQFLQNRDFRCFGGNFDFRDTGLILGGMTPIFFYCPIIAYSFGSYHALP